MRGAQSDMARPTSGPRARLRRWIDARTRADELLRKSLDEPIPGGARFAYVFGSALLFIFVSQVITGVCLAVYYVPSPLTAHVTLSYIIKDVAGGAFLRSLHSYGSSAMVVVLVLHFMQTVLYGSYKGKRELLWISGCLLCLLVLGMTFTGYLLRWDLNAYFAGSVGTNIAADVPFVGGWLLRLLRGGAAMGALTLSRFYVLHVFVIPAAIFLFIAVHIFMFRKAGAAGPMIEDPMHPHLPTETFYPNQVIIDMGFVLVVMGILGMLAHFVPVALGPIADPSNGTYLPRPEWYYLPFFQWLKFWDGAKTVVGVVVIPAVLIALFFLLPFLDRGRERRPWKRLIPVGSVLIVLIALIGLGMQSRLDDSLDPAAASQIARQDLAEAQFLHAPFEPYSTPSPSLGAGPVVLSGAALQGQTIFASQGCSGCHGVAGAGGGVGPALTHIGDRFPPAQLATLLKAPTAPMKAGGMVALTLNTADMAALVSYLSSLGAPANSSTTPATPVSVPLGNTQAGPGARPTVPNARTAALVAPASAGDKSPRTLAGGAKLYQADGCAACHGGGGKGTQRAPALVDIGSKFSALQIAGLLHNPTTAMKAGGMPPVTGTTEELASLVAYLRSLRSSTVPAHSQASALNTPAQSSGASRAVSNATPSPAATQGNPAPAKAAPTSATTADTATLPPTPPPAPRHVVNAAPVTPARPSTPLSPQGVAIFAAQGCAACHGAGAVGTKTAPALMTFSKTLTPAALTKLLQHPNKKMQAGGMPATNLSAPEMSALVTYLQNLGDAAAVHPVAPAPPAAASPSAEAPSQAAPRASAEPAVRASQRRMNQLELRGQSVFDAHSCGTCHGMSGVGGTWAAPPLANSGKNFPAALLTTLLQHPTTRMQQGRMPPVSLSRGELDALVAYVSFISSTKEAAAPTPR